ncbi:MULTISPECIES: IclR family transcriptional regulator [unclassified Streptomyces]|uniref:IclR family transcriptional regulator n=1 Tax=unclassified Streptomyces TaxID=2593676 RepID=UPI00342D82CA
MPGPIQSVSRAAAVLRLLATGERHFGLTDTASSLGLPKGTVYGILRTLQREGLVEQDPASGKYRLGAELARMGGSYLRHHELRAHALVWADDLARATRETVHVGVPHRSGVLIVHHVSRPGAERPVPETGRVMSVERTALGMVLDAHRTVAPEDTLRTVRDRGWACAPEPACAGMVSVAAPVRDRSRATVAAVSVTGAAGRVCDDGRVRGSVLSAIRSCARALSHGLGADHP